MKPFSKQELLALLIIFSVLIAITAPNFVLSLKRARDQVRRDDLGAMQHAMDEYLSDFGEFPRSAPDGKIIACKAPGSTVGVDKKGRLIVDLIPCVWGKDSWVDLTPGSTKVYLQVIPGDPATPKGTGYLYISDGAMYQLFASMEGKKEPEYDGKIAIRNLPCGNQICNVGRYYVCATDKTIQSCEEEAARR